MTKISSIIDELGTFVGGLLPSKTRLPNPYDILENPEILLRNGYGIALADGANSNRLVSCKLSVQRTFTIILTKQITTTENNVTQLLDIEKSLYEEHYTLIKAVEEPITLGGNAAQVRFTDDPGTAFVSAERGKYYILSPNVLVEYLEDI